MDKSGVRLWTTNTIKIQLSITMVYFPIYYKGISMEDKITSIKVHTATTVLLKEVSKIRGRRESMEQVILELIDKYTKGLNDGK